MAYNYTNEDIIRAIDRQSLAIMAAVLYRAPTDENGNEICDAISVGGAHKDAVRQAWHLNDAALRAWLAQSPA